MGFTVNQNFLSVILHRNSKSHHHRSLYPLFPTIKRKQRTYPISAVQSYHVEFQTLSDCKLGISRYPDFSYNAKGGRGTAAGSRVESPEESGEVGDIMVCFDVGTLYIPPLTIATTRFLGLPLPPLLRIQIVPEFLNGAVNRESGKVELDFRAKFWFSVGTVYKAPPLVVDTRLTSEKSEGSIREGNGERLNTDGRCKLVGVALVNPIGDLFMDSFLSLPTECLAVLNATLAITEAT